MSRVSQSNTPLPTPVVPGPVQPPKARSTWWVYALMLVFAALAAVAVLGAKWKSGVVEEIEETEVTEGTEDMEEEEKKYSYLSVVSAIPQTNAYTGTEEDCLVEEALTPPTSVAEPVYLVVRVTAQDELSRLARFIALMNEHEIPVTIGVTSGAIPELAAWTEQGHEVALFIDEALLFDNPTTPPAYGTWLSALHDLRDEVETACACDVTTWSGGEWYERLFDVAAELGFTTTLDWQDELGRIPEALAVENPWTPGESDSVEGLTQFDPNGSVVYLPAGYYPASCSQSTLVQNPPTPETLAFATQALYQSLSASVDAKANVVQIAFATDSMISEDAAFLELETWLTDVVDPLVASRKLLPSTAAETAAAYRTWVNRVSGTILPVYLEE